MKLAVIDPGVFWRYEPHLYLKTWLNGLLKPVLTEELFKEYEAAMEQVKQSIAGHQNETILVEDDSQNARDQRAFLLHFTGWRSALSPTTTPVPFRKEARSSRAASA